MAEARVLYGGQGGLLQYGGCSFQYCGGSWRPGIPSFVTHITNPTSATTYNFFYEYFLFIFYSVKHWNERHKYQTKSDWMAYYYHQSPNLLSINAHCMYIIYITSRVMTVKLLSTYTFVCRRMRNFSFDSFHISRSPLNSDVGVVFVIYSVLFLYFCI